MGKFEDLENLQSLKKTKVITDEEFEIEKNKILNAVNVSNNIDKKNKFFVIVLIVVMIMTILIFANRKNKLKDAYIPSVVGRSEEQAINEIVNAGFDRNNIKIVKESKDKVSKGYVFEQEPNDRIQHKVTEKIILKVSTGIEKY